MIGGQIAWFPGVCNAAGAVASAACNTSAEICLAAVLGPAFRRRIGTYDCARSPGVLVQRRIA